MKRSNFFASCLLALSLGIGQTNAQDNIKSYSIPTVGNSFEIGLENGRSTVGRNGIRISSNTKNATSVYFKVFKSGSLSIKIKGKSFEKGSAKYSFLGKEQEINFDSDFLELNLGEFQLKESGYQHIDFTGISGVLEITDVVINGDATGNGVIYANDPNYYYWAKRGPSCHMGYQIPTSADVSYFYNEVTVAKGDDKNGSYFMANGFGEGYFGMQVNSATERRILFSVWSPFHTDDPKSIPVDEQVVLLKKGEGVNTGEFGNEGSGGQSFLRYNWKAGNTYKFLLKGEPDGKNNTIYTAWFFAPEVNKWQLIASFKRPKTNTYLKGFHSFLENFNPNEGYQTRKVNFSNQWVFDGNWKAVEKAKLTVDATYHAKQRVDATGGVSANGYFLKMGGFFNDIEKPGTLFSFENKSTAPTIDFSKLP